VRQERATAARDSLSVLVFRRDQDFSRCSQLEQGLLSPDPGKHIVKPPGASGRPYLFLPPAADFLA
jgi:hypothetical protein